MEVNIDGVMDTAYTYGNERLALQRFTGWTGYYTEDPTGDISFGKPQYNNSFTYNAEDYNPNLETQYLRARYYDVEPGNFLTEDTYLGNLTDPLSFNRYNYVKSSPLNYEDPDGHVAQIVVGAAAGFIYGGVGSIIGQKITGSKLNWTEVIIDALGGAVGGAVTTVLGPKIGDMIGDSVTNGAQYVRQQIERDKPVNIGIVLEKMLTGAALSAVGGKAGLTTLVSGIDGFLESIMNGEDISSSVQNAAMSGMSSFLFSQATKSLSKGLQKLDGIFEFSTCSPETGIVDADISTSLKQVQKVDSSAIDSTVKKQGNQFTEEMADALEKEIDGTAATIPNKGGSKTNVGQVYSNKGYNPQPGERTKEGYVKQNASPEISLHTDSDGFNNNSGNIGGDFKRFGAESHGGVSPHVHQPQRNVSPNGNIYGSVGTKTANGGVTLPTSKDVKQLYEYLSNGKYR